MKKANVQNQNFWNLALILIVISLAIAVGLSSIISSSPLSSLLVLAALTVLIVFFSFLHKPVWALYFAIFFVLLPPGLITASISSLANRLLTVAAIGIGLINILVKREKLFFSSSSLFMILFIIWATVTTVWAPNASEAITILQTYILRFFLFIFLICSLIRSESHLNGLLITLSISGILLLLLSVGTVLLNGYKVGDRLQVLGTNENGLGISLLVSMIGIIWLEASAQKRSKAIKLFLSGFFLLGVMAVIGLSGSRGSAISFAITIILFLFFKQTRKWGVFGVLIAGIALLAIPTIFSTTISRFLGTSGDTVLGGREYLWPAAWKMINDHFFAGVGIGNGKFQVYTYLQSINAPTWTATTSEPLHNPILAIWADTGLIGLLLYLGVFISAMVLFIKEYLRTRKIKKYFLSPYFPILFAVLAGYMASWIKGGGMESDYSYFLMLGLLLVPVSIQHFSNGETNGT